MDELLEILKENNKEADFYCKDSSPSYFSSGVVWKSKKINGTWKKLPRPLIEVNKGTDVLDFKLVMLHEIAHVISSCRHNSDFWNCACSLYKQHGIPYQYVVFRELYYKLGSRKWIEKHYDIKIPEIVFETAREENKTKIRTMEYPEGINSVRPKQIDIGNRTIWVAETFDKENFNEFSN